MKSALIALLISLTFAEWELEDLEVSMQCPMYSCKPDKVVFGDSSVCLQVFDLNYYLSPCSKGYYCDISGLVNGRAYCVYDNNVGTPNQRYNGEACTYDYDCMSSYCINKVCIRRAEGDICDYDSDCNAGQYCYYNTTTTENYCVPVFKSGQSGCTADNECTASNGCKIMSLRTPSKNTCVPYFSLSDYSPLLSCPSDGQVNYLCSSGYCWGNTTNSMCIPAPMTSGILPLPCNGDNMCVSNKDKITGASFSQLCNCGYNAVGQSFCNIFTGDKPHQNYLNLLQGWLSSGNVAKCNTDARFSDTCIKSYWPEDKYLELKYWAMYSNLYPKVQNADKCSASMMFRSYYQLYQDHTGDSDDSSANIFGFIFALLFASLI